MKYECKFDFACWQRGQNILCPFADWLSCSHLVGFGKEENIPKKPKSSEILLFLSKSGVKGLRMHSLYKVT